MTFLFALLPGTLAAGPLPIEATVPADALAVYFSRPSAEMTDPQTSGAIQGIGRWLTTLKAMGLLPQQGRVIADVIATLPLLTRRPHALVLLDITAKRLGPGSYRLNDMRSALIVDSEGIATELDRRVRDLLTTYTDAQNGRIEPAEAGGVRYHRLTDARLPAWAVSEWGTVDGYFVAAFGQGAFEAVRSALQASPAPPVPLPPATTLPESAQAQPPTLAADPWYARAHRRCSANRSGIEIYVAVAAIEKRLENVVNQTVRTALEATQLDRADRILMTVGFDGRALHSEVLVGDRDGRDHHQLLTGREVASPEVLAQIPEGASSFAAFRVPLGKLVRRVREAYSRTQSPARRQRFSEGWTRLEKEFEFDVETGLLDQLGDHLIFHTYPPHPLKIPLLGSVWIQIDGNQAAVAQTVDAMMRAWQEFANAPTTLPARFRITPEVRRDPDGLWYLQLGLLGPALAVTDGWIVISFSPEAVRENLAHIRARAETQPARY